MAKDHKLLQEENDNLKKIVVALDEKTKNTIKDLEDQVMKITKELEDTTNDTIKVVEGDTNTETTESSIVEKYMKELGIK